MARIPKLDSAGRFLAADVNAQIDARTKATMRADLPALAKELKIGGGSGVEQVSGTVALDASGPAIREVYATGAATVQGEKLAAGDVAAFRYMSGAWQVRVLDKDYAWRNVGAAPVDPTPPAGLAAPVVTVAATADGATVTWATVSGATSYAVSVDGGPWQTVVGTSYTIKGQTSGSQHTVAVTATDGSATSPATSKTYTVAGTIQAATTDHFDAPSGTLLTAHTSGGLAWQAPGNETTVTGSVAAIEAGAVVRPAGAASGDSGGKVGYTGDVRMVLRYRFVGPGGIRIHHGGNAVNVTITKGNNPTAKDVKIVQDKLPISTLTTSADNAGVIAVQMIGTTVTCYLDGTVLGTWTAPTPSAATLGFVVSNGASVEDFKVEPVTESSAAPTLAVQPAKQAGAVLAADAFTGTDGQEVAGRTTDTTLGGGASTWLKDLSNPATILANTMDRGSITTYGAALLRVPFSDHAISAKLVKVPTSAAEVRLQARRTMIGVSEAYHMRVTSTSVQPGKEGAAWGTSFGTPQPGDVYTVSAKGSTITFTAKRADGTDIGPAQTFTDTTRTTGTLAGVHASGGSAGWAFDDVIVKAV